MTNTLPLHLPIRIFLSVFTLIHSDSVQDSYEEQEF